MLKGIAASSGIAISQALVLKEEKPFITKEHVENIDNEVNRFRSAVQASKEEVYTIKESTANKLGEGKAQIFEAHLMMLDDPELLNGIEAKIQAEKISAEYAVQLNVDGFVAIFEEMDNDYMRERAADIKDIGQRIINNLLGIKPISLADLKESCIIVAKDLTPSETAQMDRSKVLGFATDIGGSTSHSAIMARSLEIPAAVGLGSITDVVQEGDLLIIDGDTGTVIVNPDNETLELYRIKQRENDQMKQELLKLINTESITLDGKKVELAGNIGIPENIKGVLDNGGEGIGLFRTEFLYMDRVDFPTEEDQFVAYKTVLEGMKEKPVVIRTLDIGGDKKLSYLAINEEMNPFLGYRAIRLCLDQKDIFKTQLRALLRASVYGNLKIMFPMISGIEELREAKAVLKEVKEELLKEKIPVKEAVEIGIMIEIPSAAIISDILAKEVDFFSIGTNDLIQYTVAVDRMNEKVSYLYNAYNPAVLRLIKNVIDNGHREGIWVGMCGEMAGDPSLAPLLVGFGLDELSMSASSILKVRKLITSLEYGKVKEIADTALSLGTAEEIKDFVYKHISSSIGI